MAHPFEGRSARNQRISFTHRFVQREPGLVSASGGSHGGDEEENFLASFIIFTSVPDSRPVAPTSDPLTSSPTVSTKPMRSSCPPFLVLLLSGLAFATGLSAQSEIAADYKTQVVRDVEAMKKQTQVMIDMVFSFGELGFHEVETSRYLTGILEKEGFRIERGIAGLPTAWMATWGSGHPIIALGSDIDCIPQASQKPGVAYHDPIVPGAPGHGEGHNSGQPLNITSAIVVKRLMERAKLSGTIKLWPGVAEELLGGKAYLVRDGHLKGVDAVLYSHVGQLQTSWGAGSGTGLISVEYNFQGESAHSAMSPWRGRSALDAVELMNIGWNFRREHLRLEQRSHYVITNGGDQPNVVPPNASVWYYFREIEYERIKELREIGNTIAQAAAMMTNTQVTSRVLGAAWPMHFNQALAQALDENIKQVGLPQWSEADQQLARALQGEMKSATSGLAVQLPGLMGPPAEPGRAGGSDDIGDVSWTVPTVVLRFPANIPHIPTHHWASSVAMATPIAHKGTTTGAKIMALMMVDLLTKPDLVRASWNYFNNVQTKVRKYQPLISPQDKPATWLNTKIMAEYREKMRPFYYNPEKYDTYLEQLGVTYPTVRKGPSKATP